MNVLEKYLYYKQSLIYQYTLGDMTKSEYLEKNYNAVMELNLKPFKNVDSLEKGLFNYQYYNALAKEAKSVGKAYDNEEKISYIEEKNFYYNKKDNATKKILEILDYKINSAYYIKVKSKYLRGKLCEIVLNEYNMILHTTNPLIVNNLKFEMVFQNEIKKSLIDEYINSRY